MSRSAQAIAFGNRSLAEVAAALRATGLVGDDLEIVPGTKSPVLGWLILTTRGEPEHRQALYVFDGSIPDHRDVHSGERTVLSMGPGSGNILASVLRAFGGYMRPDDSDPAWQTVEPERVDFAAEDRLRIEVSNILGPKQAEAIMSIVNNPDKRKALITALKAYSAAASQLDFRDNREDQRTM